MELVYFICLILDSFHISPFFFIFFIYVLHRYVLMTCKILKTSATAQTHPPPFTEKGKIPPIPLTCLALLSVCMQPYIHLRCHFSQYFVRFPKGTSSTTTSVSSFAVASMSDVVVSAYIYHFLLVMLSFTFCSSAKKKIIWKTSQILIQVLARF